MWLCFFELRKHTDKMSLCLLEMNIQMVQMREARDGGRADSRLAELCFLLGVVTQVSTL